MTKAVLLTDPVRDAINIDTAFELRPEEADGLMFAAIIFFCRHHTEMALDAGTPVIAYHVVPMFDADNLVTAIVKGREKQKELAENSPETATTFNMDAWKDVFSNGEPQTKE